MTTKNDREAERALAALSGLSPAAEPNVVQRCRNVRATIEASLRRSGIDPTNLTPFAQFMVRPCRGGGAGLREGRGVTGPLAVYVGEHGRDRLRFAERRAGVDVDRIVQKIKDRQSIGLEQERRHSRTMELKQEAMRLDQSLGFRAADLRLDADARGFVVQRLTREQVHLIAEALVLLVPESEKP